MIIPNLLMIMSGLLAHVGYIQRLYQAHTLHEHTQPMPSQALALLDDAEDVERIAWFTARTNDQWIGTTASLLEADSPSLTPLGRRYVSYGLPADERDVPHEEATKMLTDEDAANDYTDALEDGPQVRGVGVCWYVCVHNQGKHPVLVLTA